MSMQEALASTGIIGVIAGLLLFTGGTVLLIISILKTAKGKRRTGGIIGGSIMIFVSIMLMISFGMYIITAGMLYDAPYSRELESLSSSILTSLNDKDSDFLAHLFAKESYSGEALKKEDAETVFGYIDGDIKNIRAEAVSATFKNSTYAMQEKYTIVTEDSGEYLIYISFIYGSDNKSYEGIQYIKMYKGDKVLEEFGKVPDLN